ncbi:Hsp20/alpha crystallin family protein [Methylomagnum sp.]
MNSAAAATSNTYQVTPRKESDMPRESRLRMWAQACEMLDEAERLHRRFFQPQRLTACRPVWEPPVDIVECHGEISITVVLPGVPHEAIEATVIDEVLVVSGERPLAIDPEAALVHCLEIPYGRFERHIPLPTGRFRIGDPVYEHGCLTIILYRTP